MSRLLLLLIGDSGADYGRFELLLVALHPLPVGAELPLEMTLWFRFALLLTRSHPPSSPPPSPSLPAEALMPPTWKMA